MTRQRLLDKQLEWIVAVNEWRKQTGERIVHIVVHHDDDCCIWDDDEYCDCTAEYEVLTNAEYLARTRSHAH